MRFTIVILTAVLCLQAHGTMDEKTSDEAIIQAAEKLIKEGADAKEAKASATATDHKAADTKTAAAAAAADAPVTAQTPESQIPVFLSGKNGEKSSSSTGWRLALSLTVVAAVGGALWFAGRRFNRQKDKGGNKARIEIMHQLHLGPRKSVALMRVSGETFLIGVTDQNINMLKSVTLIDDELEGVISKDFNNFLEDEFSVEDVRTALDSRV